jgi:hypothetical protein
MIKFNTVKLDQISHRNYWCDYTNLLSLPSYPYPYNEQTTNYNS